MLYILELQVKRKIKKRPRFVKGVVALLKYLEELIKKKFGIPGTYIQNTFIALT